MLFVSASNAAAQDNQFFQKIAGRWEGTLEYADYQSGERVKLKTVLQIVPADGGNAARFLYTYDDFGKVMKSEDAHRIDFAAKKYSIGEDEFSFEETGDKFLLYGKQLDNDRLEPVRETISFGANELIILKETRSPFQFRHQYVFKRAAEFPAQKTLSTAQMAADFQIFKRALTQLHPGLYRYNTPTEIENAFREMETKLKNPLPEGEFFKLLSQFVSLIACGHTYLNPLNQTDAAQSRLFTPRIYLPFYFRLLDRKMIVTGNVSSKKLAAGSEITKINGVPVEKIIAELLSITATDGRNTLAARLKSLELFIARDNQYLPFDICFPLFFPLKDETFQIEAVDYATKKPVKFQVLAMSRAERFAETERRYGKTPDYESEWKFEIREDAVGVLKIGNSLTWRLKTIDYKKFLADAFAQLKAKSIKNLVIDYRGNDGGDDDLNVEIIKHLTRRTIRCVEPKKRLVRVSQPDADLSQYIEVYSKEIREFLTKGVPANSAKKYGSGLYEILTDEPCQPIEPTLDRFDGKAFLISDATNASAAFQFVRAVKATKLATIVGEETAGNLQGINGGNYFLLRLPNSTFEIDVPVYFFAPLDAQKDSAVLPDIHIKPSVDDIAAGRDLEMNYILQSIK